MNRVAIVGSGGAGKSTFARRLGAATGLPVFHLDAIMWKPGWVMTPDDEEDRIVADLVRGERWIIDGNYGRTTDVRFAAADTIIFLDLPRWVCLWGVVRRVVEHHGETRPDMAAGCPERLDEDFLRWVWRFPLDSRPKILARIERYASTPGRRIHVLRTRREVRDFIRSAEPIAARTGGWQGPP